MNDLTGLAAYHDASIPGGKMNAVEEYRKHMEWEARIAALGEIPVKHQPNEVCDCHPEIQPFHCHAAAANQPAFQKVKVILFKPSGKYYTEEEWRIPEGKVIPIPDPIPDGPRFRVVVGPYDMEYSPDFHRIDGGAVLIETQEPWGYPHLFPSEVKVERDNKRPKHVLCKNQACRHMAYYHRGGEGICTYGMEVGSDNSVCQCGHYVATTAEQSPSYSKSAQPEHQSQYEEHQSSSHSQCKFQHDRTVVDRLVHMGNTLGSDHPEGLEQAMEQLSRLLLALWTCEEVECQVFRRLVVQGLSSPLPG